MSNAPAPQEATSVAISPALCKECNKPYHKRRYDQLFCTVACRNEMTNREMLRGRMIYRLVYLWIKTGGRGKGVGLLGELTMMVRGWIAEDKKLGRVAPERQREW